MFKYKFMNGYTAEVPNTAMNPNSINMQQVRWTPDVPDFESMGNQFLGEYLYSFVPKMVQPAVNRMNSKTLWATEFAGQTITIEFTPNQRPNYNVMVVFANPEEKN